ncbi:MAG: hypothetical protein Q4A70_02835 [Candidatus Saccharibacteria bacterium]|nr:hypothetical protein [Candidatus Saccharibacteria bacterium]
MSRSTSCSINAWFDGETYLEDLDYIFAIWGDKQEEDEPSDDVMPEENEDDAGAPDTGIVSRQLGDNVVKDGRIVLAVMVAMVVMLGGVAVYSYRKNKYIWIDLGLNIAGGVIN